MIQGHRKENERARMVARLTERLGRGPSQLEVDLSLEGGIARMRRVLRNNLDASRATRREAKGRIVGHILHTN